MSRDEEMSRADSAMAIHKFIAMHLSAIAQFMPDHCMTLVLRCPENRAFDAIISDDPDFGAVIESLQACADTLRSGARH